MTNRQWLALQIAGVIGLIASICAWCSCVSALLQLAGVA